MGDIKRMEAKNAESETLQWEPYKNVHYCPKCKKVNAHLLQHRDYYKHCPFCGQPLSVPPSGKKL